MALTYKQLQDTWVQSQRVDFNIEMFGDDEPVMIPENSFSVTLDDLLDLNITKENYHDIINIANYIMLDNVDPIVDKIVEITQNIDIVYEFELHSMYILHLMLSCLLYQYMVVNIS